MEELTKKEVRIWKRTISCKGGSFVVSIPSEVFDYLGLKENQQMVFLLDPDRKYVMIGTEKIFNIRTEVRVNGEKFDAEFFRFPLERKDLEKANEE